LNGDLRVERVGITTLDLSWLTEITGEVRIEECFALETIDFSNHVALGKIEIEDCPVLKTLHFDNVVTIDKFEVSIDTFEENQVYLESLDFPNLVSIRELVCVDCSALQRVSAPLLQEGVLVFAKGISPQLLGRFVSADNTFATGCGAGCDMANVGGCVAHQGAICDALGLPSECTIEEIDAACASDPECAKWFGSFEAASRRCANSAGLDPAQSPTCVRGLFCDDRHHEVLCTLDAAQAVAGTCGITFMPGSAVMIVFGWKDKERLEPEHEIDAEHEIGAEHDAERDWRTDVEMMRENRYAALDKLRADNVGLTKQLEVYKGLLQMSTGRTCFGPRPPIPKK
jgi:hypothetical protein